MRYSFLIIVLIFTVFQNPIFADELDQANDAYDMQMTNSIENSLIQQKPVTDEEFNKTVEALREQRKKKKRGFFWFLKGDEGDVLVKPSSLPDLSDPKLDFEALTQLEQIVQVTPTIMIPSDVITDDGRLVPTGFYKLSTEKVKDNDYRLLLTQGEYIVAKVKAYHTKEEFSPNELNFAKAILLDDRIKLIYGNLDLNLEAFLLVKNKRY